MSIRRRLALLICPDLARRAPTRGELGWERAEFIDLGEAHRTPREWKASRPCLMEAHGPGQVSASSSVNSSCFTVSLHRYVSPADGRACAGGVSSLVRVAGGRS